MFNFNDKNTKQYIKFCHDENEKHHSSVRNLFKVNNNKDTKTICEDIFKVNTREIGTICLKLKMKTVEKCLKFVQS